MHINLAIPYLKRPCTTYFAIRNFITITDASCFAKFEDYAAATYNVYTCEAQIKRIEISNLFEIYAGEGM